MKNVTPQKLLTVLGKERPRKDEEEALFTIGRYFAAFEKRWQTTKSPGAPALLVEGYLHQIAITGQENLLSFIPEGSALPTGDDDVLVFSDMAFRKKLDERIPDWHERGRAEGHGWYIVHNSKDTREFAKYLAHRLREGGQSLMEGGTGPEQE